MFLVSILFILASISIFNSSWPWCDSRGWISYKISQTEITSYWKTFSIGFLLFIFSHFSKTWCHSATIFFWWHSNCALLTKYIHRLYCARFILRGILSICMRSSFEKKTQQKLTVNGLCLLNFGLPLLFWKVVYFYAMKGVLLLYFDHLFSKSLFIYCFLYLCFISMHRIRIIYVTILFSIGNAGAQMEME